jgi:diguanylate cyclase (GGDEF)-like protein
MRPWHPDRRPYPLGRLAAAGLFLVAAIVGALNAIVPGYAGTDRTGLAVVSAACLAIGAFVSRTRAPMSGPAMHAAAVAGTLGVSSAIVFTGGAPNAGSMLYLWVALYSGYFFSRRATALQVALIAAAYAGVVIARPLPYSPIGNWATTVAGIGVAAACVRALKERLDAAAGLLGQLAESDTLTGVANRRGWALRAQAEIARAERTGDPLGIAVIDLDRFKAVNDALGHDAGDRLLTQSATAWREALRDTDFLARMGGDEFAVLLPAYDEEARSEVRRRLKSVVPGDATCSVGIVRWGPGETIEDALRRADAALYRDKARPDASGRADGLAGAGKGRA